MSQLITRIENLKRKSYSYWGERITAQLQYACKLSKVDGGIYDALIENAVDFLAGAVDAEGVITKTAATKAEESMLQLSKRAKAFKVVCVAHAHIDMNWMWGYAETVAITLETFRTMLDLMNEYPDFKFSQSQASVYRIVEEHDRKMLNEIKQRVKEERWEVTAATWVEGDKNMPDGESLSRHILYTKRYLSRLLDIDPDYLNLDFEPDTFGHSRNVPEILSKSGIKYYYQCRGYEGESVYRWQAPSGRWVLAYREPDWYNTEINPKAFFFAPEFCRKYGTDTSLKVYGVGDHGGGPTRRDIERIIDYSAWPVFPEIKFGTLREFFQRLEKSSDKLTVVDRELNFAFSGCYTTQTRIKTANRISEARLNTAECFSAISALFAEGEYNNESFPKAWENVLFSHFHDILTGSGVMDTREFAMGQFQRALAIANTETTLALRNIVSRIDTSGLAIVEEDIGETVSEGAGVGFGMKDYSVPQTERGRGRTRIYHFFNPSTFERSEYVEITVWDWDGDRDRIVFKDSSGNRIRHQVLDSEKIPHFRDSFYWGHTYIKLLVDVRVPACGYSTYTLNEGDMKDVPIQINPDSRIETPDSFVLENEFVKVVFDPRSLSIISMINKSTGRDIVCKRRSAGIFRLVEEDTARGMTAWIVGRYTDIINLNKYAKIEKVSIDRNALRQLIKYVIEFRNSMLTVTVSLDCKSARLDFNVECDWQEIGRKGKFIPQLNFYIPVGYKCRAYRYDVPFGTVERDAMDMDVPANSWMTALPYEGRDAVMLLTRTKYGFRGFDDSCSVTLIRSSYDPDPYPENGIHKFKFAVDIVNNESNIGIIKKSFNYNHPLIFMPGTKHTGNLPVNKSFLTVEKGSVAVSTVKLAEGDTFGKKAIIRVCETEGQNTRVVLCFDRKATKACYVDITERPLDDAESISVDGGRITFNVGAYSVQSICVSF